MNGGGPGIPVARGPTHAHANASRHFKPFYHRKMNPMADIQENPYAMHDGLGGVVHMPPQPQQRPVSAAIQGQNPASMAQANLIVQKNTGHLPHMPSELRHTNLSQS